MQVKKQKLELNMKQQTDSKLGNEFIKAVYCHSAYSTYMEYTMQNAGLDATQAGLKIARRYINNLRYTGATTLVAESEEELKSLLLKVKEESEKTGLKLNFQKMNGLSHHFMRTDGETMETIADFIFGCSKIIAEDDCNHEIKRRLLFGRKAMTNLDSIIKSRDVSLSTK